MLLFICLFDRERLLEAGKTKKHRLVCTTLSYTVQHEELFAINVGTPLFRLLILWHKILVLMPGWDINHSSAHIWNHDILLVSLPVFEKN